MRSGVPALGTLPLLAEHASCGLLGELHRATRGPLSVERFVRNLVLAVRSSGLQVPRDPFQAESEFCEA